MDYLTVESHNPSFGFAHKYAGKTADFKVIVNYQSYDILLNGEWMAPIVHIQNCNRIQDQA